MRGLTVNDIGYQPALGVSSAPYQRSHLGNAYPPNVGSNGAYQRSNMSNNGSEYGSAYGGGAGGYGNLPQNVGYTGGNPLLQPAMRYEDDSSPHHHGGLVLVNRDHQLQSDAAWYDSDV